MPRSSAAKNPIAFWIILAFVIWVITFFGFLSAKMAIFEDAISYYEHTKFFVENLARGVFPLWDPFWCNGASNDFFLRRIGAFNPLYLIIIVLETFKIPFALAYLWSLAFYYWGGMIAFYLLAMRLYNNRQIAYAGYLFLLFSTLGTRLFDSYMMLITVPLLWFFYFLVAFSQTPRRVLFLGLCLSLMTLLTTYIPFYFLSFLAVFLFFFALLYHKMLPELWLRYWNFFRQNKILVVIASAVVLLSIVPAILFFHNTNKGLMVLPARHGDLTSGETLVVPSKALDWGAVEDLLFSYYFSDFRMIRFAVVYIPFFAFIVFTLGLFFRLTKRAVLMFLTGFVVLCCIIPRGLPFYDFLYNHVFFLKYFRNLHFFLWFALIPLFVLLVLEHWKIFSESKLSKKSLLSYVWGIHVFFLLMMVFRGDAIPSSYVMLGLSAAFWTGTVLSKWTGSFWPYALLSCAIIIQPLEVYHYLNQRAKPLTKYNGYSYNFPYDKVALTYDLPREEDFPSAKGGTLYYASGPFNSIYQEVHQYPLIKYLQHKFILVDHVQVIDRHSVDFSMIEKNFRVNSNEAFVFKEGTASLKTDSNDPHPSSKSQGFENENEVFKVLSFDANHLKLMVQVPYEKFFIYNDSFDPSWKARVNGQETRIFQTNVAFKGIWIPAGRNIIEFSYGKSWQYVLNFFLLLGGLAFLVGIVVTRKKSDGEVAE